MFYVIEITTYNNGTADAYGVYAKSTLDSAIATFHQKMAGAINNSTYASELCMVIDGHGITQRTEYYERPIGDE